MGCTDGVLGQRLSGHVSTTHCSSTAVGHSSTVIVAGGITNWELTATSTSVVEVMIVNEMP